MEDNHINDDRTRRFVAGLRKFEQEPDTRPEFVAMFTDDATAERLDARGERHEVNKFWEEYRAQFSEIRTTFFNAVEGTDQVSLEWESQATLTGGREITYRGVTNLDYDGDLVSHVRTYYDTAAFLQLSPSTA